MRPQYLDDWRAASLMLKTKLASLQTACDLYEKHFQQGGLDGQEACDTLIKEIKETVGTMFSITRTRLDADQTVVMEIYPRPWRFNRLKGTIEDAAGIPILHVRKDTSLRQEELATFLLDRLAEELDEKGQS